MLRFTGVHRFGFDLKPQPQNLCVKLHGFSYSIKPATSSASAGAEG
jgi:hypothetical protein